MLLVAVVGPLRVILDFSLSISNNSQDMLISLYSYCLTSSTSPKLIVHALVIYCLEYCHSQLTSFPAYRLVLFLSTCQPAVLWICVKNVLYHAIQLLKHSQWFFPPQDNASTISTIYNVQHNLVYVFYSALLFTVTSSFFGIYHWTLDCAQDMPCSL